MNSPTALILCIVALLPIQNTGKLPVTIEVQKNVEVIHNNLKGEKKGVLYFYEEGAREFLIKKGQRFEMVAPLAEGSCRIRFEGKTYGITSCPWLPGFSDHQTSVFRVLPAVAK